MLYLRYLNAVMQTDLTAYRAGVMNLSLRIDQADDLFVDYAPFDHIEPAAQLAIVGLTPGRVQAANALEAMAKALHQGASPELALASAKQVASFSGPMRRNLVTLLDKIGLPAVYGRTHATDFFADKKTSVHFTSILRYPVFLAGRNYSGTPAPLSHPLLRAMIDTYFGLEIDTLADATWVPLGRHAEIVLLQLAREGRLKRECILAGLPHPSGANAERIAYFLGRKPRHALSDKTNPDLLDEARTRLLGQVRDLTEARRGRK